MNSWSTTPVNHRERVGHLRDSNRVVASLSEPLFSQTDRFRRVHDASNGAKCEERDSLRPSETLATKHSPRDSGLVTTALEVLLMNLILIILILLILLGGGGGFYYGGPLVGGGIGGLLLLVLIIWLLVGRR
jgi:hypothetical protein